MYYILNKDHTITSTDDVIKWAKWFNEERTRIALDEIGEVKVSTIFLGIDHNWGNNTEPVLFETMVFGGINDGYQERYITEKQALKRHKEIVELTKNNINLL